ncbi:hypothetical protein GCM10023093_07680 [Nemorincola caseinilytica]|uniref:Probable molybdenum cofactor guanylyltransferase n=1 Tax=Nemorincola caseinilytica TaxID=2054315 RepID=A0ABP8NAD3_9BACT
MAPLYGLVLAGGRSVRMGRDKGAIPWHGREQRYYMADMLAPLCEHVYISCRAEQQDEIDAAYHTLPDSYEGGGPLIAILSAFRARPDVAWLVVACDLPLLDAGTLRYLIANRDAKGIATTFRGPEDGLPEPLVTIWEPAAYAILLQHIANGYKCPRKALIFNEANVRMLDAPDAAKILNANTQADADKVMQLLKGD